MVKSRNPPAEGGQAYSEEPEQGLAAEAEEGEDAEGEKADVWMRDLLGVGDDTEGAGKNLWVRRLGERVGQLWLGGQALAQDHLG